ncbi:MAG TPA: sigma-70 family RNA polymerase sigma factor [Nitrospirales bacterium]|nr:sigma-70 family RNA polymerase sigma factor [Nitrospirales bacterium]HIO21017.1 sigma-70 family RNA polymerase sigma factor [Nitrospirales bacterium]
MRIGVSHRAERLSMVSTCQDRETVMRFQQGDVDAFDELARKYSPRVYNLGVRMCGSHEIAKDLMQETLISAFRGLDRFRGESKFSVWLFQIAKRNCITIRRKDRVSPDQLLPIEEFIPTDDERQTLQIADWRNTPVQELLNRELGERLEGAIAILPPDYRIVLLLRDAEGFTAEETAQILDLQVPAVKSRLHRARLAIRKQLHRYYRDGEHSHD